MTAAHGTISRYTNDACRCIPCTDSWRDYYRSYRRRRAVALSSSETRPFGELNGASPEKNTVPAMQDRDGSRPAVRAKKEG